MALKLKKPVKVSEESEDKKQHFLQYRKYYEPGVLQYEFHERFVLNIEFYADMAGVPVHFLYHSAESIFSEKDTKYVAGWQDLDTSQISGGIYYGADPNIMDRMYAMVGLMLRNYIDAKFITAQNLLIELKEGREVENTMVCIPNFCLPKSSGGNIAPWESATILGWVLSRHGNGKQTLLYTDKYNLIEKQYGMTLKHHINKNFMKLV